MNKEYPQTHTIDLEQYRGTSTQEKHRTILSELFNGCDIYRLKFAKLRTKKQRIIDNFLFYVLDTVCGIFEGVNIIRGINRQAYIVYLNHAFYLAVFNNNQLEIEQLPESLVADEFVYKDYKYYNLGKIE